MLFSKQREACPFINSARERHGPAFRSSSSAHCFLGYLCCALSLQLCYFLSPALASFIDGAASDRIKLGANIVIKINIAMKIFLGQQRKACPHVCPCTVGLTAYYFFVSFIFLLKLENSPLPFPSVHHINCSRLVGVSSI